MFRGLRFETCGAQEMRRILVSVGEQVTLDEVDSVLAGINNGRPTPAAARAAGEEREVITYKEFCDVVVQENDKALGQRFDGIGRARRHSLIRRDDRGQPSIV